MLRELPACPVETTLTLIGDKWKVLILRELMTGTKRFGELKRAIPAISQKVLTQQLRAIEIGRPPHPQSVCRSPSKSGVLSHTYWDQS